MESYSKPFERRIEYRNALEALGQALNRGIGTTEVFQVEPIVNPTGKPAIPSNLADMVVSSLNNAAGPYLLVTPFHDAAYFQAQSVMNPQMRPQSATFIVSGAVTEFDENISMRESGFSIEAYIPVKIKGEKRTATMVPEEDGSVAVEVHTDPKTLDTDLALEFDRSQSISRITIDLHLKSAANLTYVPGMHVTNTILVCEIEKGRRLGFIIYGSGISWWGKVMERQGIHQAIRFLVDCSILQLIGMNYNLPFWKATGLEIDPQIQEKWLMQWRQSFLRATTDRQIGQVQRYLSRYPLEAVYVGGKLVRQIPESEYGTFGRVTQAFALQFLYHYAPRSRLISYLENPQASFTAEHLADLYLLLIENITI